MPRYHCNNCEHNFSGSEFTEECPNCYSDDFQKVDNKFGAFIKRYWPFIAGIVVIIILILLLKDDDNGTNGPKKAKYQVGFDKPGNGNYVEIIIYKWEMNDKGNLTKQTTLSFKEANPIIREYDFEATDIQGREVYKEKGRFYPCTTQLDQTLEISWSGSSNYPLRNPNHDFKRIVFDSINSPHPKANCAPPLKITAIRPPNNSACKFTILTNKDNTSDSNKIKISISGKDGEFKKQRAFEAENYDIFNIWYTLKGDTSAYRKNGNPTNFRCCIPSEITALKQTIIQKANQFGQNLGDNSAAKNFHELGLETAKFYLNGDRIGGWPDFFNEVKVRLNNKPSSFEIKVRQPNGITINDKNCRVEAIYFKVMEPS